MALTSRVRFAAFAILAALAVAPVANADMKAFNAAVRAGDYKTAAADAKTTWAGWDKADPDTAIVAREFGFAALLAGDNDQARQLGAFLMQSGATLAKPDELPLTSAVLFRVADFRLKPGDDTLKALRGALTARAGAQGIDMISVVSWELLYTSEWNAGDWGNVATDAAAAAAFYGRNKKDFLVRQHEAEVHSAASAFLQGRNRVTKGKNDFYDAMADAHDRIVADLDAAESPAARNSLWPLKWRAEAWAMAMESYFSSTYEQVGSNISTALKARDLKQPSFAQTPEDAARAAMPLCNGSFDGRRLVYPSGGEFRGLVGSVIARMETAADGKVTKVDVVAAVPSEGFAASVSKALSAWTFKPAQGEDLKKCRLDSKNRYYRVIFKIA